MLVRGHSSPNDNQYAFGVQYSTVQIEASEMIPTQLHYSNLTADVQHVVMLRFAVCVCLVECLHSRRTPFRKLN